MTVLYMKTDIHIDHISFSSSYNKTCFWQNCRQYQNNACSIFFRKSCRLWDNVEKFCRAEQATDGNTVHAHCILGT
jgi:hypothetical protein